MADRFNDGVPAALTLPEFTRSLRGFASVRALGTREHEVVFGPLLAARRVAGRASPPDACVVALDARRLRQSFREAIALLAGERSDGDAARSRAFEARLEERGRSVFVAFDAIGAAAERLKSGATESHAMRWQAWCDAIQALFNAMDGFWLSMDEVAPRSGARINRPAARTAQ